MQAAVYYKERYEQKGRVSMKKIFSNKKVMGTLAAVMAVALLLGGTFAWRDISQNAQNVFKASSYEAELVDIFTPPSNWEKDENINKDVYVKNTGSGDIFVRVNFDDILKLAGASEQAQNPYTAFNVNGDGTADTTSFGKFEWAMGSGLIYDIAGWNGCTDAWYLDATTGWFYWGNVLNSGTQTDKLLDAVKLLTDVDKDFEYIINVNMHAFSADSKGIKDLEETDGAVNIPDEVMDMVNGIVSKSEAAAKDKAFEERVKEVYPNGLPQTPSTEHPNAPYSKGEKDGNPYVVDKDGNIVVDRVNFPDETFYNYVVDNVDNDSNGSISNNEIVAGIEFELGSNSTIKNADGIEIFKNLEKLTFTNSSVEKLPQISNFPELKIFSINGCPKITEIPDLSQNYNLTDIRMYDSPNIKGILDVSHLSNYRYIDVSNSGIEKIIVSNTNNFYYLAASKCPNLTSVSGIKITTISDPDYASIQLTNCPNLENVEITDISALLTFNVTNTPNVTELDLTTGVSLTRVNVSGSNIQNLDVSNSNLTTWKSLQIQNNDMKILNVSGLPSVVYSSPQFINEGNPELQIIN